MLKGLDEVDWSRLSHAYGPAMDVPGLIRQLLGPSRTDRDSALSKLAESLTHQGNRCSATAVAVPFLAEVVRSGSAPDREGVVYHLVFSAIGFDDDHLPNGVDVDLLRRSAASSGPGSDEQLQLDSYEAVRQELPTFRKLLGAREPKLRTACAYALAWFPEDARESLIGLRPLLRRARSRYVKATAMVALGLLAGRLGDQSDCEWLSQGLNNKDRLIRWASATTLARILGRDAPEAASDELVKWITGREDERLITDQIPFMEGQLQRYAVMALECFRGGQSRATDVLIASLSYVKGDASMEVVGELLEQAFPPGRYARHPFARLSEIQQRVLTALAENPRLWDVGNEGYGDPPKGLLRDLMGHGSLADLRRYVGLSD
jgi:hypothetical protein